MLQETMKKITDAESEADEIIRKAKEEADYTVAAAKKEISFERKHEECRGSRQI